MGFISTCCTYCCAVTGGFGFLFLGTFAIALKLHAYFIPEVLLLHEGDDAFIDAAYDWKALAFAVGAVVELLVMGVSVGCVFSQRRKARSLRAKEEAREAELALHREAIVRKITRTLGGHFEEGNTEGEGDGESQGGGV